MTTIRVRFPASRYHATPWGRHVNEGATEWPPAPYRLLRALYDVWQRKCSHLSESAVAGVLEALASSDPGYALPHAAPAHTRSYLSSNSEDPTDKNLVFDGFLAFSRSAVCYVTWRGLQLSEDQRDVLAELLANLNYLGRSESWVEAALHQGEPNSDVRCDPLQDADYPGEVTPVACVVAPREYTGKRPWLEALTASTSETLRQRRSGPPLLRMSRYVRPEESIVSDPVRKPDRKRQPVNAVLLGLDATPLPLATTTLEVAEQIRMRLMGAHKKRMDGDATQVSRLFSGKDEQGQKLLDHSHLFILPLSNCDSRIDKVLLVSRMRNLLPDEMDAVRGVRELYQADGRPPARCVVVWQGLWAENPVGGRTTDVVSFTPFVTARHMRKGRKLEQFLEDEIRRECRNHGLPEPLEVEPVRKLRGLFDCIEYRRNRKNDPVRPGYAFRLKFAEPVAVPFSLGYGCHFGLGQFDTPERS